MFLVVTNDGPCGINVNLNGHDKGRYWGRVGPTTDGHKLASAWLANEGIRGRVTSATIIENTLVAELDRA